MARYQISLFVPGTGNRADFMAFTICDENGKKVTDFYQTYKTHDFFRDDFLIVPGCEPYKITLKDGFFAFVMVPDQVDPYFVSVKKIDYEIVTLTKEKK
jgi:hypothetical protein